MERPGCACPFIFRQVLYNERHVQAGGLHEVLVKLFFLLHVSHVRNDHPLPKPYGKLVAVACLSVSCEGS